MVPFNEDDAIPEDVALIVREQAEDEALPRDLEEQAHRWCIRFRKVAKNGGNHGQR